MGRNARSAARALASLETERETPSSGPWQTSCLREAPNLLEANEKDVSGAAEHGLSAAAIDRLRLTEARIAGMAEGIRQVANLEDPVGQVDQRMDTPKWVTDRKSADADRRHWHHLRIATKRDQRCRVLCIKTANAVILRGGSESLNSNLAIAEALQAGGSAQGLPANAVQLIPTKEREAVALMAAMNQYIDLIIPRGGPSLIETVVKHARMPVIKHYHGVCHVYVDDEADLEMADRIAVNAKCQRPAYAMPWRLF